MANQPCPYVRVRQRLAASPWAGKAAQAGGSAKSAASDVGNYLASKTLPRIEAAWEWASPRVEAAWRKGVIAAAPKVEEAARALAPKVDDARDAIVERALPAIVAAVDSAARAAAGAAAEPAVAKKRRVRKVLIWSAVAATAGAAVLWFWRQTRPVTDPWAEDDWDDDIAPEEDLADAAGDAAEAVGEAAGHAVKAVTDAARRASDAVKKAGDAVKKAATDAVRNDEEDEDEKAES